MPKFFVSPEKISGDIITIDTDDTAHIKRVLRLGVGDTVTVCDSRGVDYDAEITEISNNAVICKAVSCRNNNSEPNISVTLYQALPKASKMEYIIQKNTELGIVKIVPCELSRCVVKLSGQDAAKKCARWQKIADEAAKQSGRGILPEIAPVLDFKHAVEDMKKSDLCFVPYESEDEVSLRSVLTANKNVKSIAFMIGPEGGFSPEEIAYIEAVGIPRITLGPRILRTETAGEATLAMVMYELGDIN